jgi:hypothetical protein
MRLKVLMALTAIFAISLITATAQPANRKSGDPEISENKVEVYYFHYSRRCAACQAVEDQSKKALEDLYPEQMKKGDVVFIEVNLEDNSNGALMEKLNIQGQTLLVVKGNNQKNITHAGFMHARSRPDRLREEIKKAIESL